MEKTKGYLHTQVMTLPEYGETTIKTSRQNILAPKRVCPSIKILWPYSKRNPLWAWRKRGDISLLKWWLSMSMEKRQSSPQGRTYSLKSEYDHYLRSYHHTHREIRNEYGENEGISPYSSGYSPWVWRKGQPKSLIMSNIWQFIHRK